MDLRDSLVVTLQWIWGGLLAYGGYLCITHALCETLHGETNDRSAASPPKPAETPLHAEEAHS